MKIKTATEFLTFNDGSCEIWSVKGNKCSDKLYTLAFGRRTISIKRYYSARAASTSIDDLIHVHLHKDIDANCRVKIGGTEYKIEQVQRVIDSNPPVCVLTLRKVGA